jgi:predicted GIY-YIG superfamily endonuclease
MLNPVYLYMLTDPTGAPTCYIGLTEDPRQRIACHLGTLNKEGDRKANWLSNLREKRIGLGMAILKVFEGEAARTAGDAETNAIRKYKRQRGDDCLNRDETSAYSIRNETKPPKQKRWKAGDELFYMSPVYEENGKIVKPY